VKALRCHHCSAGFVSFTFFSIRSYNLSGQNMRQLIRSIVCGVKQYKCRAMRFTITPFPMPQATNLKKLENGAMNGAMKKAKGASLLS